MKHKGRINDKDVQYKMSNKERLDRLKASCILLFFLFFLFQLPLRPRESGAKALLYRSGGSITTLNFSLTTALLCSRLKSLEGLLRAFREVRYAASAQFMTASSYLKAGMLKEARAEFKGFYQQLSRECALAARLKQSLRVPKRLLING